jgi:type II restriction/modification system DNA methylase subunit YeeA
VNISQIQENLKKVISDLNREEFIYDLLNAYGKPKASISRLKNGTYNLSKNANEVLWKKEVLFVRKDRDNLHSVIDEIRKSDLIPKHKPRFLIVTNFELFLAVDTKTNETLDIAFAELDKNFDFFLPWAGMEKAQQQNENPADVKAAEKMAKLYDEILKDNPTDKKDELHKLNVFLSRLLFCFFAEDTEIFPKSSFTHSITSHTQQDGSDLDTYLSKLFEVLNTQDRSKFPEYLKVFPYVNGGLFTSDIFTPKFSRRSRNLIIECGELDWSAINPDIFGSMFQAVVHTEQRSEMGMHYTSVPNIMKVIEPLFLNELSNEFAKAYDSEYKLEQLLLRLEKVRIFDPACGSGNFLIISYREIRFLEMKILQRINELSKNKSLRFSNISLSQFYGIELDDFAHEIAILSLWLAEHQMNVKFQEVFGSANPSLPLKKGGNIICDNATRVDWKNVCPNQDQEVYVLGNPPYQGARKQSKQQKNDLSYVFDGIKNHKNLDFIACWFFLGAKYIQNTTTKLAFVSTNSINQGEQVGLLWEHIFNRNIEIFFCHQSFKWSNNAKKKAAVICVIVGLSISNQVKSKQIFSGNTIRAAKNINAYLIDASNIIVKRRTKQISHLPPMPKGNMPYESGKLIFTPAQKLEIVSNYPSADRLFKLIVGAKEYINGITRWCLWIKDLDLDFALSIPPIKQKIDDVRELRTNNTDKAAQKLAARPHQFREINETYTTSIVIPSATSERREYIPIGFIDSSTIVSNLAFVIYEAKPYMLGILSSRMHMTWVRAIAGRLKSDYRYSSELCYNTFPIPKFTQLQIDILNKHVMNVLLEREKHSEKTLADLYDPKKMPSSLNQAHKDLDSGLEQCYRSKPFNTDEERLEYLFTLYEQSISKGKY